VLPYFLMLLAATTLAASDPYCPRYPESQRQTDHDTVARDRLFARSAARAKGKRSAIERRNLIDEYTFTKMEADSVEPAPLSSDSEFLRRVSLDLTGRIPTWERAESFLASNEPNKRLALVEELLKSDEYVDRWSLFYRDLFEITSRYYNYISPQGRNRFNDFLHDFLRTDRSYAEVAREIITAEGDSHESGPVNFISRAIQQGDPVQDTWDTLTDRTTVRFLGMKTECVSCHDGRRHLEEINLFLTGQRRTDFWRMSAFYSRTNIQNVPLDPFFRQTRNLVTDRPSGSYFAFVSPNAPGPRPSRFGGPYEARFILNGEMPATAEWRRELARLVTENRQFARAAVNYLWAAVMGQGIVDPPDGWDLARIDPKNPPRAPWTLQPSHPELIEALATEFIKSNYSVTQMLRLIVTSSTYQLSSRYPGVWRPEYERYFAKYGARRLEAEFVYDSMALATNTQSLINVEGVSGPVRWATQLPDPSEPRDDGITSNFLTQFGRGDYWNIPKSRKSTVLQTLFLMNDSNVNFRTFANRDGGRTTRVADILQSGMDDTAAIRRLFLATLSRYPTDDETAAINRNKRGGRDQWLADLQWALLNKVEFLFNY
jgi:hypothetical protein